MTTCNKCGDCCENIWIDIDFIEKIKTTGLDRKDLTPSKSNWIDFYFIKANWISNGDDTYSCNMFNKETRLCEAHDERPPVCVGYPWYGREPNPDNPPFEKYKNCAFWEDINVTKV
jgi:Fe-S-cluster containining protein